jgi:hypothetical protein
MSSFDEITTQRLSRIIGLTDRPLLVDVHQPQAVRSDPRKIVRIACPWLIRRFIDPGARFLFVAPVEVPSVAEQFKATPFDTGHGLWNDRGEQCTFDVMLAEFGLETEPLLRLAEIVRGADTDRLELAPQCAGLLAASLGFSRMYYDDIAQLDAAMALYDAF